MEFKVWVDNVQRVISGVNNETTCRDIVLCLAQATQQFGKFVLIEKWRNNERLLAPNELPIQLLNKWGDLSNEVCFLMRRSDHHQQLQLQQQQKILNEATYGTRNIYNTHPLNQNHYLPNQYSPYYQQGLQNNSHLQSNLQNYNQNNLIYKNVVKNNYNSQPLDINQPLYATTKFTTTQITLQNQINPQVHNQILQIQPNVQNNKLLTIHQHSPQNHSPSNHQIYGNSIRQVTPQQYSPNVINLNNNILPNSNLNVITNMNNLNQINNMNQINSLQSQIVNRQNLEYIDKFKGRPKCPPPYNEAIAKSSLIGSHSPVNTSHSPSLYVQPSQDCNQNRYFMNNNLNNAKLSSIIHSNSASILNRNISTPSPNILTSKSHSNLRMDSNLSPNYIGTNYSDQTNNYNSSTLKQIDKKNFNSNYLTDNQAKGRVAMRQINSNNSGVFLNEDGSLAFKKDQLNEEKYEIYNQQDQLEVLQRETQRIEFEKNKVAKNINETDLKIAKCRQKIQVLMDEIKDVSVECHNEKLKIEEEINLKQISEIKQKIVKSLNEYEQSSDKLNKLQKELDSLEDTLSQRKKLIEHLTNDIKEANIEGLTLVPVEDQNGNLIEDENKPPMNENYDTNDNRFNIRLGSTRRISGCPRELGNAVPTSKNPHGVWV